MQVSFVLGCIGDRRLLGPEIITQTVEIVKIIRERLKTAQDRLKKWADLDRRPLEFEIRDKVFLKISPTRGVIRFGNRRELSPKFIGPFEILERVRVMAYRLALPPSLDGVHDVFHVSQLRRYIRNDSHVVDHSELEFRPDLSYTERPVFHYICKGENLQ